MKVIDIVDKIALGVISKNSQYRFMDTGKEFYYDGEALRYLEDNKDLFQRTSIGYILNDEIELIEEDTPIEEVFNIRKDGDDIICSTKSYSVIKLDDKINELVQSVNELKKEGSK